MLNSLEHLVEYYSILSDGLPTVLTIPVPPPPKPDAPPVSVIILVLAGKIIILKILFELISHFSFSSFELFFNNVHQSK